MGEGIQDNDNLLHAFVHHHNLPNGVVFGVQSSSMHVLCSTHDI